MNKSVIVYLVLILLGIGTFLTIRHGAFAQSSSAPDAFPNLAPALASGTGQHSTQNSGDLGSILEANMQGPLGRLLLQVIIILIATRVVGWVFVRMGQPSVVGEMFAGIFLGPSLFGFLFPEAFNFFFSASSLGTLRLLSQIGVCLFMFAIGMELDLKFLRGRASTAVVVSQASIVFPYALGVAISLFLFRGLAAPGASFVSFALFMGIFMSITAFPVLARILQERRMEKTPLGSTAVACAAVGDVSAWAILAFVVAVVRSAELWATALCLSLVVLFVMVLLYGIRPRLSRWLGTDRFEQGVPSRNVLAAVLVFTFLCSLATETIGIHALFGAFMAGVVMPEKVQFRKYLTERIENFSSVFLLPLFFAFTGLRTHLGSISDAEGVLLCCLIIVVATVGKIAGSAFPARFTGMGWADSFRLGALMNTRGLMELIAINIGYDLGILSPRIFAMLVIMALVTTFMTGPLLSLIQALELRGAGRRANACADI